ncbi:hypothetical protein Pla123a_37020 [Posidoniimonas polymericola]|uniref:Transmembrane protein n=1 Tax=Posidoniimonas polymericola TaxID=2528002 RepID=A0A5C5YFK5_9BACT|nr:hypothetical protein [Posidoniimonas polymericola]TWT73808.1 hypothetical protein Pla123a_37020 [Posidoniimonas polymericola]
MQFSLKEFLAIAGVVSVGTASLLYASSLVSGLWLAVVGALLMGAAIHSALLAGARRASAVGFLVAALVYTSALLTQSYDRNGYPVNREFEPWAGRFPTTIAMQRPYQGATFSRSYYTDENGNRYSQVPAGATVDDGFGGGGFAFGAAPPAPGALKVKQVSAPPMQQFMEVAHCLWTLLFGYVGGKYAVWLYTAATPPRSRPTPDPADLNQGI